MSTTPSRSHRVPTEAPRLRSPSTDVETACTRWLTNAIPTFEPPRAGLLEAGVVFDSSSTRTVWRPRRC